MKESKEYHEWTGVVRVISHSAATLSEAFSAAQDSLALHEVNIGSVEVVQVPYDDEVTDTGWMVVLHVYDLSGGPPYPS